VSSCPRRGRAARPCSEALTVCVVNDKPTHVGKCFCGAVEFSVTGKPEVMGYCHCSSCREWGAAPVNTFTLWRRDKVHVTKGADKVGGYRKTPQIERKWCTLCGGHLLTDIHSLELVDVYAPVLPTVRAQRPRALSGDRASNEGRTTKAKGFSEGAWRLRYSYVGIGVGH
jgi:hypothetical protein